MIGDIAKTIIVVEADTSDAIRNTKKLAAAEEDAASKRARHTQEWKAGLASVGVAFGVAYGAGKLAFDGMEQSLRKAQLSSNVWAGDVAKLTKGLGGLRTEMQGLELANKLHHAAIKLSSSQYETVGKAIRQLVREGHDWQTATDKVTESITKLDGGPLQDLNIRIREGATDGEKFAAVMEGITGKANQLGDASATAAEKLQLTKSSFTNTMDQVRQSLGEIAVAFLPIVESIGKVAGFAASIANALPGGASTIGKIGKGALYFTPGVGQAMLLNDIFGGDEKALRGLNIGGQSSGSGAGSDWGDGFEIGSATVSSVGGGGGRPRMPSWAFGDTVYGQGDWRGQGLGSMAGVESPYSSISTEQLESLAGMTDTWNEALEANRASGETLLERLFGPVDAVSEYEVALKGLSGSFGAFIEATQAGFGAWIDGSKSVRAAFRDALREGLKSTATEMWGEGVKHLAYAAGSIAFGRWDKAAMHGKAAAMHFAGAASIGALAKTMYGGGNNQSSGSSAVGGGVPAYSGSGGSGRSSSGQQSTGSELGDHEAAGGDWKDKLRGKPLRTLPSGEVVPDDGPRTTVIVLGQDYTTDTARAIALRTRSNLDRAEIIAPRSGGWGNY